LLKCRECGNTWKLEVSFPLKKEFKQLFHYCPYCRKNTFHDILEYVESGD
jgi:ribosomal protein L44E